MLKRTFRQQATLPPLVIREDNGRYRQASAEEIIDAAISTIDARFAASDPLTSPEATKEFLKLQMAHLGHEVFAALWMNNRHSVIAFEELFRGTIDGASVHPREVVKAAMSFNAAACILCHNHPSGIAEPSEADRRITARLKEALALVDVRVLDHIVIGKDACSFAERGLL